MEKVKPPRVGWMFRAYYSKDGRSAITPGFVDRTAHPEIPDSHFVRDETEPVQRLDKQDERQ
jgi:hypothetical protein